MTEQYFIKNYVKKQEYIMHKYAYELNIFNIPRIINYNEEKEILIMEKINGNNLSFIHGDQVEDVPKEIIGIVYYIIKNLKKQGIKYPDITGYNFVQDENIYGKIWIIDFEHASFNTNITNEYINDVCNNGLKEWNPDFK